MNEHDAELEARVDELEAAAAATPGGAKTRHIKQLEAALADRDAKLAAVEALLPNTDEQFPIFPDQIKATLGATLSDYLLIPRAALSLSVPTSPQMGERREALADLEHLMTLALLSMNDTEDYNPMSPANLGRVCPGPSPEQDDQ